MTFTAFHLDTHIQRNRSKLRSKPYSFSTYVCASILEKIITNYRQHFGTMYQKLISAESIPNDKSRNIKFVPFCLQ